MQECDSSYYLTLNKYVINWYCNTNVTNSLDLENTFIDTICLILLIFYKRYNYYTQRKLNNIVVPLERV